MVLTSRRAVLTGLGLITPIGSDPTTFLQGLLAGTPGVRPITHLDPSALPTRIAGLIPEFDAKKYLLGKDQRRSLKAMAKTVQMGASAAQLAMNDAKLAKGDVTPARFGTEFACVMVTTELDDLVGGAKASSAGTPESVDINLWGTQGLDAITPLWMLKYLPNMAACHTSIFFDARGPNNTIIASDAAGLLALGEAYRIIQRDDADFFLVGGVESRVNTICMTRHNLFASLSKRNDEPATAVRPFDATRDGTVLAEAAAVFGLEELETAQKRNAKILAEVVGFASGFDRNLAGPVFANVMRLAMKEANVTVGDIDHVNAAAGGVVKLDAWEARAIAEVFGTKTPVFSAKGHLGNSGAAASLVELAASVLALNAGMLPGTLNYHTPDPACPIHVHAGAPRATKTPYAIKLAFTDLGQCSAVVIRKWE